MPQLDRPKLALLGASLVAAFGIGLAIPEGGEDAPLPTPQRASLPVDTARYHAEVAAYRAANPGTVDLLSAPVEAGEQVVTGVNVPLGQRPSGVEAVGGSWRIDSLTYEDRAEATWIEVKATNTGSAAARFVGMVEVE
jgi:hypothetical protein